jgi:GntR family transcriptional regulator
MDLVIDPSDAVPVSEQIAEGIRFAIAAGQLAPGGRLPSVRGLARELLVNPNTVAKVYRDLEREGVLRTKPGSGAFVAPGAARGCRRASRGAVRQAVEQAVAKARAAGLTGPDIAEIWRECIDGKKEPCHGAK